MNDGFERIIVRRIPSRVIKFCINGCNGPEEIYKSPTLANVFYKS